MRYLDLARRRWPVVVAGIVVVALLGAVGAIVWSPDTQAAPGQPAVERYGFASNAGGPWAPESGRLQISRSAGTRRIAISFRFRTQDALNQFDGRALEFRLTVTTPTPCQGGWASAAQDPVLTGLSTDARPYAAVSTGPTCGDTLLRLGVAEVGSLVPGSDYTLTADVPAGLADATVATLTVARRTRSGCDDKPSCVTGAVATTGPDVKSLVGTGWAFNGAGCRRWFADAVTSFPCLPDRGAKIMTLGDSITSGFWGDHTWRYRAWQKLQPAASPVWTGLATQAYFGDYAVPSYKWGSRHDAEAGISADARVGVVPSLVTAERPDILLIDLGTNDPVGGRRTAAQTAQSLDQIVAEAQAIDPTVQILIAQPYGHQIVPLPVMADLAVRIASIAVNRTTSDSLVTAVDLRTGWRRNIDTWDGTHPTQRGEYVIASRFVNTLANTYAYGCQFGPIPALSIPDTPTGVRATTQPGSIQLSWDRVAQSSAYHMHLRDTTLGGHFQLMASVQPQQPWSWGRSGLISGHAYEYYVTALASGLESHPSSIGTVIVA